ncbi:hypothetical protein N7528_003839 [Penicillium herquei]|nr:hypothetical protein N7528_003839 [Penicillium herquei]
MMTCVTKWEEDVESLYRTHILRCGCPSSGQWWGKHCRDATRRCPLRKLIAAKSTHDTSFAKYTEIAGYAKASLWMSCKEHNDFDVGMQIRKISKENKLLEHLNYPCPVSIEEVPNVNTVKCLGPQGFLRASHTCTKVNELSNEQEIFYKHDRQSPIPNGSIIKLEITLWPMGMVFVPGEGLMLRVSGYDMCYPEINEIVPSLDQNENLGYHEIHAGGEYDSCLVLPFI